MLNLLYRRYEHARSRREHSGSKSYYCKIIRNLVSLPSKSIMPFPSMIEHKKCINPINYFCVFKKPVSNSLLPSPF